MPDLKPTLQTAQNLLLEDLYRFGVRDFLTSEAQGVRALEKLRTIQKPVAKTPSGLEVSTQTPRPKPVSTQKSVPEPRAAQSQSHQQEALLKNPSNCVALHVGEYPLVVAVAGLGAKEAFLSPEEHTLLTNMLKAIGLTSAAKGALTPSWLVLHGEAGPQAPLLTAVDIAALHPHLCSATAKMPSPPHAILALGTQVFNACANKAFTRRENGFLLGQFGATPLVGTYGLQALLRQPKLKRQAWADLLKLKEILEGLNV